jgi:HD-GYP domain-containing protein (c-di-GMP phosphodiesterase class II)
VDGKPVFATVRPITGTPFALLQEYSAKDALGIMVLYKPGIYLIVSLLMVILAALMLALTLHLMGQRNRTRVKLMGQTMEALVRVVEARDPFLSGHHSRVARLAVAVGNKMDLSVGERATLFYAAQLSSVGRLLVPRGVLAKKGKLSDAERAELEEHINQAVEILGDIEFDLPIMPVISQMYEREDGTGHPLGIKGEKMNRMAKVLGACDAYVAMTSDRAHRKAMTKSEAIKAMASGSFSGDIVAALKSEK